MTPAAVRRQRKDTRGAGRLAQAAHWHAAHGLAVFPVAPGAKVPAVEKDWEHQATTDHARIDSWWGTTPFNIGIATGPSGLLVVDLDRPKEPGTLPPARWRDSGARSGRDVLDHLAADVGTPLPPTWRVTTPSGGEHLYFRQPGEIRLGNSAGRLGWKIDTRGHGGYVLAAGSVINDTRYHADVIRRPSDLPEWITRALTPPPHPIAEPGTPTRDADAYGMAALTGELDRLLMATEGERNDSLNRAAFVLGQLIPTGALDATIVHDELVSAAGRIGLGRREAERTIESGLTAGTRHPRHRRP